MSTPHPTTDCTTTDRITTDRITTEQPGPTLADDRWRAADEPATPESRPTRRVQRQFAPDGATRLHNLVDEANRATLD